MNIFSKHPESIGETYWQHLYCASLMGGQMLLGGIACVLHAIFPFIFEKTASNTLMTLTQQFLERSKGLEQHVIQRETIDKIK